MATNDITGDSIKSKLPSKEYEDNYDKIFNNEPNPIAPPKPLTSDKWEIDAD